MRSRSLSPVYAHTYNTLLSLLNELSVGDRLPVQSALAERCRASRTTIHHALHALRQELLIGGEQEGVRLLRKPRKKDFLPEPRSLSRRDEVEEGILEMLIAGRLKPGTRFSELALARTYGVTTGTIREALLRLARLGVFAKSERKQWKVTDFNADLVNEMMDLRILIECYAMKRYFCQPERSAKPFARLLSEMRKLAGKKQKVRDDFFRLDRELHHAILVAGRNRFLVEHFQFVSFPIQIQFLHHNFDRALLQLGLDQHIALLEAILADDKKAAVARLEEHLQEARKTLLHFQSRK
jgi:DNA-binding GntR family transcriptional regulator